LAPLQIAKYLQREGAIGKMLHTQRDFRIHYDLLGPSRAEVVCMTHSMTSDSGMWAEQVPSLLTAGFQVLRIDMRGHGGSEAPGEMATLKELALDVLGVLDGLGMHKAHYIGLSIGGMIGLTLALNSPARFNSFLLADTAYTTVGDKAVTGQRMKDVKAAGHLLGLVDGNMERRFSDEFRQANPIRSAALRETLLATKIPGYLACTGAMQNFDYEKQLPEIKTPTLVVCGSDDLSTTPEMNRKIAGLIPGAAYVEIAGGRHFPNVEFPDEFNAIMLDWLNRQRGGR
jgi:3-oxoadipate enol-lactonase